MPLQSNASPAAPAKASPKPGAASATPSAVPSETGLCVVAGLDFTDADGPAFDLAARIARRTPGSQVHLLHVFGQAPSAERSKDLVGHLRLYVDEKTTEASGLRGVTFGIHLRGGKVVRELMQLATEVRADFIVLGSHKGVHLAELVGESTLERLIRSGSFPVLVAPNEKAPVPHEPTIEPPCPDCVAARVASGGQRWWCERHSHSAMSGHVYSYQRELPFATHDGAITPTGIDF